MGRWAQRRRAGGGPPTLNYITEAAAGGAANQMFVRYAQNVDETQLIPSAFEATPSTNTGDTIDQLLPNRIRISFTGDVDTDTTLIYGGSTPGILTPQTVSIIT